MKNVFQETGVVILAAGKSTRMRSKTNKLLLPFDGQPLIKRVYQACQRNEFAQIILVIGPDADEIKALFADEPVDFAIQKQRLGTAHALMQAIPLLYCRLKQLVLVGGDHPFMTTECIKYLVEVHQQEQTATTLLTAIFDQPPAAGRIIRDECGNILRIVEEKDATEAEKQIREVNISIYCFDIPTVIPLLDQLQTDNVQQEYYLTDIVEILLKHGHRVKAIPYRDNRIGVGINNRVDLAQALKIVRTEHLEKLMRAGVTILDPNSTFIDSSVKIGQDTIVYPFCYLEEGTVVGNDCIIGPHVKLSQVRVADGQKVEFCVIENSTIDSNQSVKPFSYIRDNLMIK